MKAVEFEEVTHRIAEHQEEYQTLPAHWNPKDGSLTVCFELDEEEMTEVKETGKIWLKIFTAGKELQPIGLTTRKSGLIEG